MVRLARALQHQGVVGVDLCGDPARGGVEALQPAFEEARRGPGVPDGLGITLHFAEAEASGSDAELIMLLRAWRPDRIGHVIHVGERVRREIVAYPGGLGLELCLSCNVHAGMVSGGFEAHHFGEWCELLPFLPRLPPPLLSSHPFRPVVSEPIRGWCPGSISPPRSTDDTD